MAQTDRQTDRQTFARLIVVDKWTKKRQNKNTSLSSSLFLVLCGSFTAPLTGLAYILQWFCCVLSGFMWTHACLETFPSVLSTFWKRLSESSSFQLRVEDASDTEVIILSWLRRNAGRYRPSIPLSRASRYVQCWTSARVLHLDRSNVSNLRGNSDTL